MISGTRGRPVLFDRSSWLGTWFPSPFAVHNKTYHHVEGWMQARKHSCNPEFAEAIRLTASASQVCDMGGAKELWADLDLGKRALSAEELAHWHASRVKYLREGCLAKFRQNRDLAHKLLETADAPLVFDDPNPFYGRGADDRGENFLGRVLVSVRTTLRGNA